MKSFLFLLLFWNSFSFAESADQSLRWSSEFFGVSVPAFQSFFAVLPEPKGAGSPSTCLKSYQSPIDQKKRDLFLDCLRSRRISLGEELFSALFDLNASLRTQSLTPDLEKTLLLNQYLMDLARQSLSSSKRADWYFKDQRGFLQSENPDALPLESGDMLLNFGGGGTSGLITRTASPAFRASHGVILKKEAQKFFVMESLPHLGARKNGFVEYFSDKNYHTMVLRWKNIAERPLLAVQSATLAEKWAEQRIPFDSDFSSSNENEKMYCTLMTGLAYSKAAQKPLYELYPESKNLMSSTGALLSDQIVGKNQTNYVTAASLLRSPFFEMTAEFRDTQHLYQSWQIDMLTELMMQKTQQGYRIKPDWLYSYSHWLYDIPFLNKIPVLAKAKALSDLFGRERFAALATYEKKIIEKTLSRIAATPNSQNLILTSPWQMRHRLSLELDAIATEQLVLAPARTLTQDGNPLEVVYE